MRMKRVSLNLNISRVCFMNFVPLRFTSFSDRGPSLGQLKASASLPTSRQQKNPRLPHFFVLPVFQDAGVHPRVLLRHVDDPQQRRALSLLLGFETRRAHVGPAAENLGVGHPAQELHLTGGGDDAEPEDRVARRAPVVADDGFVGEELGVKSQLLVLLQDRVPICGNRETVPKSLNVGVSEVGHHRP